MNAKQHLAYLPRCQQIGGFYFGNPVKRLGEARLQEGAAERRCAIMNKASATFVKGACALACVESSRDAKLDLEGAHGGFDMRQGGLNVCSGAP